MIVAIDAAGRAALEDTDNFRAFKIVAACPAAELSKALASIGATGTDGHAWVARKWVLDHGRAGDVAWRAGFDKMIAYAKDKGWMDEARDLVRAHVEQA